MRWIIRLVVLVVLVAVVAIVSFLMLPGDRIAKIAADQLAKATGRTVKMEGDTTVSFYPILGISTGRTTVANAPWSDKGPMFVADSFKVGVDPVALIQGSIKITGLEAVNPKILLERAKDGRVNWEINVEGVAPSGQGDSEKSASSNRLALTLDRALISGASLRFIDARAGSTTTIEDIDLDARWPSYTGEASFDVSLRPADERLKISGTIARLDRLIEGEVSEIAVKAETKGGSATFDGRAGTGPSLAGAFRADLGDTRQFLGSLGLAQAEIPQGLGRKVSVSGQLTLTDGPRISLREMTAKLDQNRLVGGVDVTLGGARPFVSANLDAGALDLTALDPKSEGESGQADVGTAVETGWSTAPIDASALGLADAKILVSAESLDLGTFEFGQADVLMTVDRARAVFQLHRLEGYGGSVTGQFVANNRNGLSVGGDMRASDIDMEALLTDAAGITRFATDGTVTLDFLGVGQSVDAIMKSLRGNVALSTGRGVISGIDLDRLMRSGDVSGGTTVFDEMSASFVIADGDMQGDDLKMSMPLARATGKGRIGLGARDLNYTFTPSLLEGESRKGLAIPVRIKGPWADPKIYPDLEAAIDLNFKEEKKELEKKAREEVEREVEKLVEKELGVTVEEGQSVEDAIIKEAEDALAKELFKLFD
ncbi:AsmA family protein [Roseovarius sp. SCSIO 43702]|uniref:AsmA family protein n=1 Tax=Roseovarius sp. SCSIO 43702 TaxID=2823043 RepID=UPI001C73BAEA|nr:AsmA family protein [Roseovarius sp. SCSIO 43702]QYX57818.1 AsmA family protein [Roseovarius sp. SCSIO 43702]